MKFFIQSLWLIARLTLESYSSDVGVGNFVWGSLLHYGVARECGPKFVRAREILVKKFFAWCALASRQGLY
jgi:hypothetical protein